ncbi:MAG: AtpZ/AtpI family protein [Bauldia sp.]|nr:AtpZ/AtpI family protein [Bauldia sp.]
MSEPDAGNGDGAGRPTTEQDSSLSARLRALGDRLNVRRVEMTPVEPSRTGARGESQGMKIAAEFVAGILVGGAIGWFLDNWLGTSPWGLIVFVLLGFAAGVLNALRTAGLATESPARLRREGKDGTGDDGGGSSAAG